MSGAPTDQDTINRRVYHARRVPRSYVTRALDVAETTALLTHQTAFANRDVLDLGVGTGRTTRYLRPLARRYVGVDYSPTMVAFVRRTMPDVDVRCHDMRDLSEFPSASFDCVLAACNLVDAVSHLDRLRVLGEVHRVLRPAGTFIFSSHNRMYRLAAAGPRLEVSWDPVAQLWNLARYVRRVWNYARFRHARHVAAEYALLNDPGHHFALLHYYIDFASQQRQLEDAGFALLDAFARDGRKLRDGEEARETPDILYVARRRASTGGR